MDHETLPPKAPMPVFESAYTIPRPVTTPVARFEVACWWVWPCGCAWTADQSAEEAKKIDGDVDNMVNECGVFIYNKECCLFRKADEVFGSTKCELDQQCAT